MDWNEPVDHRPNRGFHKVLEQDHPHILVDGCVQVWPDADFSTAHQHGCTCYAVTAMHPGDELAASLKDMMFWHLIARQHENIRIVWNVSDITDAKANGQAAFLLAAQDGEFVGGELHRLEAFWRLGLRMVIPAYNRDNLNCGGALDDSGKGLTAFGRRFVQECDRLGIVLDCSHVSERSALDMIEQSRNPVVYSHANPRALVDSPRNVRDHAIRACAARGGVIGTVNWGPLIFREGMTTRPTVHDWLDHVDYLADLLGSTANIGIGTDFSLGSYPPHGRDPWGGAVYANNARGKYDEYITNYQRAPERFAEGFDTYPQIVDVISLLGARGYSDDDIGGILGGNFMRVFGQVWR